MIDTSDNDIIKRQARLGTHHRLLSSCAVHIHDAGVSLLELSVTEFDVITMSNKCLLQPALSVRQSNFHLALAGLLELYTTVDTNGAHMSGAILLTSGFTTELHV